MRLVRLAAALLLSSVVAAIAAQQPPQAGAKPDTADVKTMIDRLRATVGPRWGDAVHFWCEEPRANRPDDPPIPPTRIFDNVFAIGNSGTTVYVIRTSSGLLMIDALGGNDAQSTNAQVDVLLQNHMLMDPIQDKLEKVTARKAGDPNPFVVGAAQYQKFLDVMDGCTRVNIARRRA